MGLYGRRVNPTSRPAASAEKGDFPDSPDVHDLHFAFFCSQVSRNLSQLNR